MTLMRGVTSVRATIKQYLTTAMPAQINIARTQWALTSNLLPYPVRYDSYDPLAADLGAGPVVGSMAVRSNNFGRIDWDAAGDEQYRINYAVRVFTWLKTPHAVNNVNVLLHPEYEQTLKARDDMVAVLRSCILKDLSLGTAANDTPAVLTVNEGTLAEEYPDAMKKNEQINIWYAGGSIAFDVEVVESQYHVPLGTAATITTSATRLNT